MAVRSTARLFAASLLTIAACTTATVPEAQSLTVDALKRLPPQTYVLVPDQAEVGFMVRPVAFPAITGTFESFDGAVMVVDASAPDIKVLTAVDVATVETGSDFYDNAIKSGAWFDVEAYPRAIFSGSLIDWTDTGVGVVDGTLTIRDVTRPAQFAIQLSCDGVQRCPQDAVGFDGEIVVSRSAYGMSQYQGFVRDKVQLSVSGTLVADASLPERR
ncbi:MAG: YceI family protein [Pseudomonadota bacterium]